MFVGSASGPTGGIICDGCKKSITGRDYIEKQSFDHVMKQSGSRVTIRTKHFCTKACQFPNDKNMKLTDLTNECLRYIREIEETIKKQIKDNPDNPPLMLFNYYYRILKHSSSVLETANQHFINIASKKHIDSVLSQKIQVWESLFHGDEWGCVD